MSILNAKDEPKQPQNPLNNPDRDPPLPKPEPKEPGGSPQNPESDRTPRHL